MRGQGLTAEVRGVTRAIERGVAAWERNDYALALACFRNVLAEHPDFADVRNRAGLCLAMLGDMQGALEQLDRAVAVNPGYAEAHLNRSIVLNELGRFDDARVAYERAGELESSLESEFPSDLGNRLAIAHARVAELYLSGDRPAKAIDEYLCALKVRPGFLDIRSKLAEAYLEQGDLGRARSELEEILRENPSFTAARIRLGVVLLRSGEERAAVREWTRCAEEDPADARIQAYLASVQS